MLLDIIGEASDLLQPVLRRNRDQNGLVEPTAHHFHLLAFHQRCEPLKIFRMGALDPFKQRPGIVQPDANGRMPLEDFDEWQVGAGVGPLEYVVEISHWLMRV